MVKLLVVFFGQWDVDGGNLLSHCDQLSDMAFPVPKLAILATSEVDHTMLKRLWHNPRSNGRILQAGMVSMSEYVIETHRNFVRVRGALSRVASRREALRP